VKGEGLLVLRYGRIITVWKQKLSNSSTSASVGRRLASATTYHSHTRLPRQSPPCVSHLPRYHPIHSHPVVPTRALLSAFHRLSNFLSKIIKRRKLDGRGGHEASHT
jgi:hypothetical protein